MGISMIIMDGKKELPRYICRRLILDSGQSRIGLKIIRSISDFFQIALGESEIGQRHICDECR
jgi:hypothetical protein